MGSECSLPWDSESRSPSPTYGRNQVVMKRAPSITSAEMRAQVMKAEVEQAQMRQDMVKEMKNDFEEDRKKLKQEIRRDFQAEAERREFEAELKRREKEKAMGVEQQEFGLGLGYVTRHKSFCIGANGEREKTMRVDWSQPASKRIHVVVRVRPLNMREIKEEAKDIIYMDEINHECTLACPPGRQNGSARKSITFVFDRCYNGNTNTAQVYNEIPYSLTQSFLEGYNATVFAYGQTGSGKSFTMQEDPDHIGIIPRSIVHIFEGKTAEEDEDTMYDVRVSYIEIYNEEIRDLLADDPTVKLEIKGDKVAGLNVHPVDSISSCAHLLKVGIANRITSATTMNAHSSRSHAIFTVYLQVIYTDPLGKKHIRRAKLNLVDLAGSERHGKTGISTNEGHAFTESKSINLSLSCLGKDSLGGNARTMMIACLSPSDTNFEETLSTLKYAHTTKSVNNRPVMNIDQDPKDKMIRELQNEIKALRHRLDNQRIDTGLS